MSRPDILYLGSTFFSFNNFSSELLAIFAIPHIYFLPCSQPTDVVIAEVNPPSRELSQNYGFSFHFLNVVLELFIILTSLAKILRVQEENRHS